MGLRLGPDTWALVARSCLRERAVLVMVCTALSHSEVGDLCGYYNSFPADSSKVSFQILKFLIFLLLLFKFPFYSKTVEVRPCLATSVQYLVLIHSPLWSSGGAASSLTFPTSFGAQEPSGP